MLSSLKSSRASRETLVFISSPGNLGFSTYLVADACFTFGRKDWNGTARSADDVHAMSLAKLDGEYCTVVTTGRLAEVIRDGAIKQHHIVCGS